MGKLIYLVLAVIVVHVALLIAFSTDNTNDSSLWALFLDPTASWDTNQLTILLLAAITAVSIGSIIAGTLFFKSDFMVLAGIAGVLFSFGKGLLGAWTAIYANVYTYAQDSRVASLIASFMVSPIIFLYVFTIFEWWRGRD